MGTVGDKFVAIAPEFYLLGLITEKGITKNGAWDFIGTITKYQIQVGRVNPLYLIFFA